MTPGERQLIQTIGFTLYDDTLLDSALTLLAYGFFAPLFIVVIQFLARRQTKTLLSWAILVATVIGFLTMTVNMITSILSPTLLVNILLNDYGTLRGSANHYSNTIQGPNIASAWQQTLPPIFNDGVIIWRAWAISGRKRRVLYVSIVSWTCSFAVTLAALVYQSIHPPVSPDITDPVMSGLLASSYISSLAVNVAGTGLIGYTLWNNLRMLRQIDKHRHLFNMWRILLLLFESGAVYAVVQVVLIVLSWNVGTGEPYHIAFSTFSAFYFAISMVYPALTIAIINGPFSMDRVQESVVKVPTLSEATPSV